MRVRKTKTEDIDTLMTIYHQAKTFMRETGNPHQWVDGYPSRELITQGIADGHSYVCVDPSDTILATFYFKIGIDPSYATIYNGQWPNDAPYGVIHRLASTGKVKDISSHCLRWCFAQCPNIRVDTHKDNLVMRNVLERNGYQYCGIIRVQNGTERLVFQKQKSQLPFE